MITFTLPAFLLLVFTTFIAGIGFGIWVMVIQINNINNPPK